MFVDQHWPLHGMAADLQGVLIWHVPKADGARARGGHDLAGKEL